MSLRTHVHFYLWRLRRYPVQELLAAAGIAIGIALAFAVWCANGSILSSSSAIVHAVAGDATLQLEARGNDGLDEQLITAVRALPGVRSAAPLLEQRGVLVGPDGTRQPVTLASIDPSLATLSGSLPNFVGGGLRLVHGVVLPTATADALGLRKKAGQAQDVELEVRGRSVREPVATVLGQEAIGPLAATQLAIMPLRRLQALAGQRGRITRILIETAPQQTAGVRAQLEVLAGGRITVAPADAEIGLLRGALGPIGQATSFFAAMSALMGLLFSFNAVLLTAPERRRLIAELRIQGFRPRQLVEMQLAQAAVLGLIASAAGVLVGSVLARSIFQSSPDYLSPPFTLGHATDIGLAPVLIALVGGIAASCAAAVPPLLDLRRGRAIDAVFRAADAPGNGLSARSQNRLLLLAVAALIAATVLLVLEPKLALVASALLALTTLLAIPTMFALVIAAAGRLVALLPQLRMLQVALLAIRATTVRSLALAATGAVAVFGCVAIGGARVDVLRGIAHYTSDYVETADVWITAPNDNQATGDFRAGDIQRRLSDLPGVADVRVYQGSFLDVADRRIWLIARPASDPTMLPASQIVRGNLQLATARVRGGGWIAASDQLARDRHLAIGDAMTLPTPSGPQRYRLAATTTNLGWSPGAVIMNRRDYRAAWRTEAPTALELDLATGAGADATLRSIQSIVHPTGLVASTAQQRGAVINASAHQGLNRLTQIAVLLLIAAVLAMSAAMGAAIWQRRAALAGLRIQSFTPRQLLRVLMIESALVLTAGCVTGAVIGTYGQIGADRFLASVTGFPVAPTPAGWQTATIMLTVLIVALATVAIPGWFAARTPPAVGLRDS